MFYFYDFSEYASALTLTTDDYETQIDIDCSAAWDEDAETWDDEKVVSAVSEQLAAAYPGAAFTMDPVPIEKDLENLNSIFEQMEKR